MADINNRVKELRNNLGLTQEEFAKKIKLETSNAISMIEREKAKLTEQNILLICTPGQIKSDKTVSELWLRNGEGEMFIPYARDNHQEHELLEIYRNLLPPNRKVILDNSRELLKAQKMIIAFKTENIAVQKPELIQTEPKETSPESEPKQDFPLVPRPAEKGHNPIHDQERA
jgi:transcriptional regulator with XRE-family HTH domain